MAGASQEAAGRLFASRRKPGAVSLGLRARRVANAFKGASLDDPRRLFNAGLDAKTSRAIDIQGKGKGED